MWRRSRPIVAFMLAAVDDRVDHPVLQQELRALEPLRELLLDRLLDHPRPAKPISAPGSARMTSPSMANDAVTPPVVGSVRIEMYGSPPRASCAERAEVLAICISERIPSIIRAPPEALHDQERVPLLQRARAEASDLLADHRAHAAAE